MTLAAAVSGVPVPAEFRAATVIVYAVRFTNPVIVHGGGVAPAAQDVFVTVVPLVGVATIV